MGWHRKNETAIIRAGSPVLQTIADAAPETLVDALVQLTHQIHGAKNRTDLRDLRARRGLLRAEILRRMGDPR